MLGVGCPTVATNLNITAMIIEATNMIDRMKRAHIALLGNCLVEQSKPGITSERYAEMETEIAECEKMIEDCSAILKAEEILNKL